MSLVQKSLLRALPIVFAPTYRRLISDLKNVKSAQDRVLQKILAKASRTEYGLSFGLREADSYEAFSKRLPVSTYDSLSAWMDRQRKSHAAVLVADPILFFEKTSGSSGAAKYIPYTQNLKSAFNRMFRIWAYDLLRNGPELKTGRFFFSISPALALTDESASLRPVGLEDDSDYLTASLKWLLNRFSVGSPVLKRLKTPLHFKRALACLLIEAEDLEIISIWSPSYLETLLEFIESDREIILQAFQNGALQVEGFRLTLKPLSDERRALVASPQVNWAKLWPELRIISSWASAQAQLSAYRLKAVFPNVFLQAKGLLATEAPLTLPLLDLPLRRAGGFIPLLGDIFFEFESDQKICRLHELELGETYTVLITTPAGLLRYRLGDQVKVTGFFHQSPCLEFVGRMDRVSDLVGEKLSQAFVETSFNQLDLPSDSFYLLLPQQSPSRYVLALGQEPSNELRLANEADSALSQSPHYRYARELGQLKPLEIQVIPNLQRRYHQFKEQRGMKWGDIKPQSLFSNPNDAEAFLNFKF